jgi:hypothetical protein
MSCFLHRTTLAVQEVKQKFAKNRTSKHQSEGSNNITAEQQPQQFQLQHQQLSSMSSIQDSSQTSPTVPASLSTIKDHVPTFVLDYFQQNLHNYSNSVRIALCRRLPSLSGSVALKLLTIAADESQLVMLQILEKEGLSLLAELAAFPDPPNTTSCTTRTPPLPVAPQQYPLMTVAGQGGMPQQMLFATQPYAPLPPKMEPAIIANVKSSVKKNNTTAKATAKKAVPTRHNVAVLAVHEEQPKACQLKFQKCKEWHLLLQQHNCSAKAELSLLEEECNCLDDLRSIEDAAKRIYITLALKNGVTIDYDDLLNTFDFVLVDLAWNATDSGKVPNEYEYGHSSLPCVKNFVVEKKSSCSVGVGPNKDKFVVVAIRGTALAFFLTHFNHCANRNLFQFTL